MGQRVDIGTAAWLCGRSPKTVRRWTEDGTLPYERGERNGGTRGHPGHMRWIDTDHLRLVHERQGGKTWRGDALPPPTQDAILVELVSLRREVASLRERLDRSERSVPLPRVEERERVSRSERSSGKRHVPAILPDVLPDGEQDGEGGPLGAVHVSILPDVAMPPRAARPLAPLSSRQRRGKLDELPPVPEDMLHLPELPATWATVMSYATGHGGRENQRTTFLKSKALDAIRGEWRTVIRDKRGRLCHWTVRNVLDEARMARFHELWRESAWWRAMAGCALCERGGWANHEAITSSVSGNNVSEA